MIRRAALVLVFASLAWTSVPRLWQLAREASSLAPLGRAARRSRVNGPVVEDVKRIKRALPPNEPVALIGRIDDAILANYYGYPWRSRDYRTLDQYRAMAGQPGRPNTIVAAGSSGARIATYAELRDARLRVARVVRDPRLNPAPAQFFIPLAGSVDGLPPDTYVTEADFANDADVPAHLRVSMMPEQKVATLTIPAHGRAGYYDLVYQLFGVMEVRWLAVESDRPVRAAVSFVNRGRNLAVRLPLIRTEVIRGFTWPVRTAEGSLIVRAGLACSALSWTVLECPDTECKAWVINLNGITRTVEVAGMSVPLAPYAMESRSFRGTVEVWGADYAFATTREQPTRFVWRNGDRP